MESSVQIKLQSKYEVQIGLTTKLSDDSLTVSIKYERNSNLTIY
jgi:hypothetical protein